jgi:hypothetical protein
MSTNKTVYLVFGCRFNSDWVNDFYLRDNHENIEDLLSDECFIIDGMNGNYAFLGKIKELDQDSESVEIDFEGSKEKKEVEDLFIEHFSDIDMPEIKMYYVNHLT